MHVPVFGLQLPSVHDPSGPHAHPSAPHSHVAPMPHAGGSGMGFSPVLPPVLEPLVAAMLDPDVLDSLVDGPARVQAFNAMATKQRGRTLVTIGPGRIGPIWCLEDMDVKAVDGKLPLSARRYPT